MSKKSKRKFEAISLIWRNDEERQEKMIIKKEIKEKERAMKEW